MMKIGIISSYLPLQCGIATYSSYLIEELRKLGNKIFIVCHKGGKGPDCYPVFDYDDRGLPHKAFKTMMSLSPDLVHIQHEYGLFGEQRGMNVIPLGYKFKLNRMPIVITLHTVLKECLYEEQIIEKALVEIADAVVVHEHYQRELIVKRVGSPDKIWVIRHGVRMVKPASRAKERLGLADKKIVLLGGYFRRSKNFESAVRIFQEVTEVVDNAVLLIASGARRPEDIAYQNEFLDFVAHSEAEEKTKILLGPFSQERFDLILSSADVAVLPYLRGAQSGMMAHCHAFAKPMVVSSDVKPMADLVKITKTGLVARTDSELAKAIVTLLNDKNLSKRLSDNARRYVEEQASWQIIASRHMDVYNKVLKNRPPDGGNFN